MRYRAIFQSVSVASLAIYLAGCAQFRLKDEPADLYGPGMTISALSQLAWEIGPPTTFAEAETSEHFVDNDEWRTFKQGFTDGDELRSIRNNAGMGFARFHAKKLVDDYYWIVF